MTRIGVIGSGNIGATVGDVFRQGHPRRLALRILTD